MLRPETVAAVLRAKGELWEPAPGLIGLRGSAADLMKSVSQALSGLCAIETSDEWIMPPGTSFRTLERAKYFESFPHWMTAASHLSESDEVLERVARSEHPGQEAANSLEPADAALSPAVCYNTYARLANTVVRPRFVMTAEATCWRHEGARVSALQRGWAFRMREVVFLGEALEAEEFRQRGIERAAGFAESIGVPATVVVASDPFFAPTSRGKALLQQVKTLKQELVVESPGRGGLAISSFNNHERFFGEAFDIRLPDGLPVTTSCVAFGVERWMLAILMAHGTDAANWPELEMASSGAAQ